MFVVVVFFEAKPEHVSDFKSAILENAAASVRDEPGCRQFDVAQDPARAERFFLYEIYDDEAAFKAHIASPHFKSFDAASQAWVADKKVMTFGIVVANRDYA
jgi:quinol monooxygenase YgiN